MRLAKPNGPNSGPKDVWSAHGPWKESGIVFIQILVIAGWIFLRMIFEKINRIKTQIPGRKAKFYREQGSQCSSALLFAKGYQNTCEVWIRASSEPAHFTDGVDLGVGTASPSPAPPASPSLVLHSRPLPPDVTQEQGQLESLHSLSGQTWWDYTESILLQQSSDVFQAKTQSGMFWPKGNIYNQIIHLRK